MANGNGGDHSHKSDDTESRIACSGAGMGAAREPARGRITAEQYMLGFVQDAASENIPDDALSQTSRSKRPAFRLTMREYGQHLWDAVCDALLFEYERGTVFLLLAVMAGTGAIYYFSLNQEPYWVELLVPESLLGWLWFLLRDTLIRRVSLVLILAFIAGMSAAKWETQRYATQMLGGSVSTVLTARIVSMDQEAEENGKVGRWRIVADVLATEKPHLRYAPQRLRLSARDLPAQAETGSVLKGAVRLRPHGGPVRSEQYDFAFYGYFRGTGGNGFYLGVPKLVEDELTSDTQPHSWSASIETWNGQLRAIIGGRIMQALPGEEGAVAAALISGQRAGIKESTNEDLRMAGLAHILSISGLHLALAAGIVMVSMRGIAGLFPSLSLYYPVKKIAALISLFSAGFYLAVSGADVAAQRSFIMLTVMLGAVIFDRKALTMRNLAIAALFNILLTPHEILGPSFQMSYSATGALIAGFSWWKLRKRQQAGYTRRQTGLIGKLWQWLSGIAATSLLAGTASGLYSAFHFNNMAPLGMLGNALALPAISFLVMPFAVLSLLVMPLGLEWLPLQVMGIGVELVKWSAHFVAGLSPDMVPGMLPVSVLLLWTAAMLAMMIFTSHLRLISLILLAAGGIVLYYTPLPDIIISEDARLIAVRQNNVLYVNRARPSAFTVDNWRKAYDIADIRTPKASAQGEGYICEDGLCSFDLASGQVLAYAENRPAAEIACKIGDIIVLAYAGNLSCHETNNSHAGQTVARNIPVIITRQQLALQGVAEIYLKPDSLNNKGGALNPASAIIQSTVSSAQAKQAGELYRQEQAPTQAKVIFAVGEPHRPWHLYRLWSRAARNQED